MLHAALGSSEHVQLIITWYRGRRSSDKSQEARGTRQKGGTKGVEKGRGHELKEDISSWATVRTVWRNPSFGYGTARAQQYRVHTSRKITYRTQVRRLGKTKTTHIPHEEELGKEHVTVSRWLSISQAAYQTDG